MEGTIDWKAEMCERLNRSQRIELAMDLWDSVASEDGSLSVSEEQRQELRRRVDELDSGRMQSHPWSDVKQRLLRDVR